MMRSYYAIGAVVSPLMTVIFRLYNRIFKTVRPRVLIATDGGEVLLVRSWTGHQGWELPGGGKGRHESSERAAKREVKEELGIDLSAYSLEYVETIATDGYEAPVFRVIVGRPLPLKPHKWELSGATWRSILDTSNLGPVARRVFENDVQNTRHLI